MFHAVIVGVSDYADDKIHDLQFARADAEALAALCQDARDAEDDDVFVYFAGHGSPEVDVSCGAPSMVSDLAAWVRRLKARHVAVVVDASFNGTPGGRTFEGPGLWSGPRTRRLERVGLTQLSFGAQGTLLTA